MSKKELLSKLVNAGKFEERNPSSITCGGYLFGNVQVEASSQND
jgi:hypothetical protein